MHMFKVALLLAAVAATAYSQALNCTLNPEATLHVRPEGEAERVAPFVVVCTGGIASASVPIDITVTLNTNLTSLTFATDPVTSEALLLIDFPDPNVVDTANGFSYDGQVLGTPFAAAGSPGSGNVYQAEQSSATSVTWHGVPFVAPGPSGRATSR
jgi:hypothetical protein